jgi:hypothetical protein
MQHAEFPEDVLRELFRLTITQAQKTAEARRLRSDGFLFNLNSPNLDTAIHSRFSQLNDNSIEQILRMFEKIDQSNKQKDVGRDSLTAGPFTIDVTSFQLKEGVRKRKHGGGCGRRRLRPFFHNINEAALIVIDNTDTHCLFRSAEMCRAMSTFAKGAKQRYKKSQRRQQADVTRMMGTMQIEQDLESYTIEEFGPLIQNYYEMRWPGKFKLFAFKENGIFKPFWQSDVEHFEKPICLFYHEVEEHFDAVSDAGKLFGRSKYCFKVNIY